jgi:hypothetical protein
MKLLAEPGKHLREDSAVQVKDIRITASQEQIESLLDLCSITMSSFLPAEEGLLPPWLLFVSATNSPYHHMSSPSMC